MRPLGKTSWCASVIGYVMGNYGSQNGAKEGKAQKPATAASANKKKKPATSANSGKKKTVKRNKKKKK